MKEKGKALIFSAPSGSGKTTVVKYLINKFPSLKFSVSATTRKPRGDEVDGKDYYFFTEDSFKEKITNNELLEYEEVYPGKYYGTLTSEVDRIWNESNHVVFDVDVVGGVNLKKKLGTKALGVFVKVGDIQQLRQRLERRGTDQQEEIDKRVEKAKEEMTYENRFDITLINDNLDDTLEQAEELVKEFLEN